VLWDVGGGGFYKDTGGRPRLQRRWLRARRARIGVRAGDELDAGEGWISVRVVRRRPARASRLR
jgi:hypothetical protein